MTDNPRLSSRFTPQLDDDSLCERTCAILKIYPGKMHPLVITERLHIAPTRQIIEGEYGVKNSMGRAPIGKLNAWFLSSEEHVKSHDLRQHLDWLLYKLSTAKNTLLDLQGVPDVRMGVECPWWAGQSFVGGPVLWPEQMAALADLNLECSISFSDYNSTERGAKE